tara:strand:+ start:262 stop:660 length:399 start_codon:yes stop_codon:yes gene_type:complete
MGATKVEKVIMKFDFGFAQGATVAAHKIGVLPAGAIITNAYTDCTVDVTSGGAATVALGYTGAAAGFLAATAKASLTAAGNAIKGAQTAVDGVQEADEAIVLASDVEVIQTNAVAALTAGGGSLFVEYVVNS